MFFQNPRLPTELILNILDNLSLNDSLSFLTVSKEMHIFIKDASLWKKFGAANFEEFIVRIKNLPENLRRLVLKEEYTLPFAEVVDRILNLSPEERLKLLLMSDQVALIASLSMHQLEAILSNIGIVALLEGSITLEQVSTLDIQLDKLFTVNGAFALRKRLISPEQVATFHNSPLLGCLLTDNGVIALQRRLITPEQANTFCTWKLKILLTDNGIVALQCGLINPEQANLLTISQLEELLSDNGIIALQEGKITPEQAAKIVLLDKLLTGNGFLALMEGLIDVNQLIDLDPFERERLINDKIAEVESSTRPAKKSKPNPF